MTDADRQRDAEAERRARLDAAGRDRPVAGPAHHRVDVAVVPHVDRAARAGGDRDAQHGGERQHRVQMTGRDQQADQAGEHHQRHHPRLQQRDPVATAPPPATWKLAGGIAPSVHASQLRGCVAHAGSADARQFREGVERRRRGHGPFQRRGALAPVVVGQVLLRGEGAVDHIQEHQERQAAEIGADRGDEVPAGERLADSPDSAAACPTGPGSAAGRRSG